MIYPITISEREVELAWTHDVAKRFAFRASKLGGAPTTKAMRDPKTSVAAVTAMLWMLLPAAEHEIYPNPEELFVAIDHDTHAVAIHAALVGVFADMTADPEKKSTGKKSPSRKSN